MNLTPSPQPERERYASPPDHRPLTIVALAASGLFAFASTATAETITVCANGCDYTSINDAIDASSDGDVIQLAAETYFEGEEISPGGKAITLRGVLNKAGEPASVLDGAAAHTVLICYDGEGPDTSFENLVIQNGFYFSFGGGMSNDSSSPTLTNCTFTNNSAELGGGMYNLNDSTPTLIDCNFCGNTSATGNRNVQGDIDASSSGNLLLANCNPGDANFDLEINRGDVIYVVGRWKAISVLNADINQDGVVNIRDLVFILINFAGTTDDTTAP